jgi:hypothetical protein
LKYLQAVKGLTEPDHHSLTVWFKALKKRLAAIMVALAHIVGPVGLAFIVICAWESKKGPDKGCKIGGNPFTGNDCGGI